MPSPKEIVIVSCGLCSSLGANLEENLHSVFSGKDFFEKNIAFESPKYSEKYVGIAKKIPEKKLPKSYSKCARLLYAAVAEALQKVNLPKELLSQTGVFLGTSIGGIFEAENNLKQYRQNLTDKMPALRDYECSSLADIIAKNFGLGGLRMTFSTACSSSGLALDAARKAMLLGQCKAAIVCGVDALSRITVNGFGSLLLLSKSKSKPFDKNRDGINLGEGAGAILLLEKSDLLKLKVKSLALLSSTACSCDAYHATAPHPEGKGAALAMSKAIKNANLSPKDISFIFAHGTGTDSNDSAEFLAMNSVFKGEQILYASNKAQFGHTLGASGIINTIIATNCIVEEKIPASVGFESAPETITKNPNLETKNTKLDCVLTSSLGFGGNNSSAVISSLDFSKNENLYEVKKSDIYLKTFGLVSPLGNSKEEFFKNLKEQKFATDCDTSSILKAIPALKKRKFARMQQMAMEASCQALTSVEFDHQNTCVCFATGLGMTSETAKFIENIFENAEEKPMPSAFTNSVHNAPSSAIANQNSLMGLNSALTAKEVSFESSFMQVQFEISTKDALSALIVATDEKTKYASIFQKSARYSKCINDISECAIAYFADSKKENSFAKLLGVKIRNKENSANLEFEKIKNDLAEFGVGTNEIKSLFIPQILNSFEENYYEKLAELLEVKNVQILSKNFGVCYVNSSYMPIFAFAKGKGKYLQINLTSTGQIAILALEIL